MKFKNVLLANVVVVFSFVLAACGGGQQAAPTAPPTKPAATAATPVPQATNTPVATSTPSASGLTDTGAKGFSDAGKVVTLDEIRNAKYGGTLQHTTAAVPADPDPSNGDGGGQWDLNFGGIFEKLTEWNQFNASECIPDLAEKWTLDSTGKVYTFNLRPGIKWHDGTALTADDVVASFEYRKYMWQTLKRGIRYGGLQDPMYLSSRAIDPLTAEITLKGPSLSFMPIICSANFNVFPKAAVDRRLGKEGKYEGIFNYTNWKPIGTGPFKWTETKVGEYTTVERNVDYWRKDPLGKRLPYLDGYKLTFIGDTNVRIGAMRTGRIDYWPTYPTINTRVANELFSQLGNKVYGFRGVLGLTAPFTVNGQYPLNSERDFRWALTLVGNWLDMGERVYEGSLHQGEVILSDVFPKDALPKAEALKSLVYNPDRTAAHAEARRLLAKLGINPANFEVPLSCTPDSSLNCESVEYYALQLRNFGFRTKIEVRVPGEPVASDAGTKYAFSISTNSISAVEAGVVLSNIFLSGEATWLTPTGSRAPAAVKLRELYELAANTPDPAVRVKAYWDAQRIVLNEDANKVIVGYWNWNNPVYSYVHGLFRFATMSEGSQNRYTWLDK